MQRNLPPFRADHVGSILRTAPLKEARLKRAAGQISTAELAAVENAEISKIIAAHTTRAPKMTIPSPSMLHYRGGRNMIDRAAYPTMEAFYHDLGQAYK